METRAEYEQCRALGFDRFQGHFFAQPVLVEGDTVPTHRLAGLTALAQVAEVYRAALAWVQDTAPHLA